VDNNENVEQTQAPPKRLSFISPQMSILLIGGAALGLIVLMCLTIFIIIAVKT
jgi:hypothetical protein